MSRAEIGSAMPRFLMMKKTIKYLPLPICARAAYTSYQCTPPFAILLITGMERGTSSASATDTACFSAIFPTTCSFQMMSVIRNGCPPNFSR